MKQKILLSLATLFLYHGQVLGQVISPQLPKLVHPTPNVMAFNKYGNTPANLFTGAVNISVPIYTIKTPDRFEFPVSLVYHASGIKVDEISSNVGLGWALNSGGVISRVVKGKDDFSRLGFPKGENLREFYKQPDFAFFNPYLYNYSGGSENYEYYYARGVIVGDLRNERANSSGDPYRYETDQIYVNELAASGVDGEPDMFNYSLPTGESGKFYFDQGFNAILVPRKDITIKYSTGRFEIIDKEGTTYIYTPGDYTTPNNMPAYATNPTTSWKVQKIVTKNGYEIEFFYQNIAYSYYSSIHQTKYIKYPNMSGCSQALTEVDKKIYSFASEELLDSITFGGDKSIRFLYNDQASRYVDGIPERRDLVGSKILRKIQVSNGSKLVKDLELEQSYFVSAGLPNDDYYHNTPIEKAQYLYRLKLDGVKGLLSGKNYKFKYEESVLLPPRFSYSQDFWGYYNGKFNTTLIPSTTFQGSYYPGANRGVSPNHTQANILTKIVYPTRGYTLFEYENMEYDNILVSTSLAGGVRIKKMTDITDSCEAIVKRYEYKNPVTGKSSGQLEHKPIFEEDYYIIQPMGGVFTNITGRCKYRKRSIRSIMPLGTINGSPVGYPFVTVIYGENSDIGRVAYEYSYHADWVYSGSYPNTVVTNNDWKRGLLKRKTIYKKAANDSAPYDEINKIKEIKNYYEFDSQHNSKTIPSYNTNGETVLLGFTGEISYRKYTIEPVYLSFEFFYTIYDITSGWVKPVQTTIKDYYPNGTGDFVQKTTLYYYGNPSKHLQLTKKVIQNSKGNPIIAKLYYPGDVMNIYSLPGKDLTASELDAIKNLQKPNLSYPMAKHQIDELIQTEKYMDSNKNGFGETAELLVRKRIDYKNWGNYLILPKKVETSKGAVSLKDRILFHNYDDKGNPLELSNRDGPHIFYLWGYNDQYPIAMIKNATYAEIANELNPLSGDLSNIDEADIASINALRAGLPKAQVTTYTYEPLVGVTSITDPKGRTSTYHYDAFNRLEFIKDEEGNILKEHKYHYKTN